MTACRDTLGLRNAFEMWAATKGLPTDRVVSDARYCSMETEYAFQAWCQARLSQGTTGTPAAQWRENTEPDPHGDSFRVQRARLAKGHLTDDQLANAVFMEPTIPMLTAAKERIRWLSRRVDDDDRPVHVLRHALLAIRERDTLPDGSLGAFAEAASAALCQAQASERTEAPDPDWKAHVHTAYACLRAHDNTIPDDMLDAFRDRLLQASR